MPGLHPALGATSTAHDSDSLFSSPDGIKGRAAEEKGVSPAGESGVSSQVLRAHFRSKAIFKKYFVVLSPKLPSLEFAVEGGRWIFTYGDTREFHCHGDSMRKMRQKLQLTVVSGVYSGLVGLRLQEALHPVLVLLYQKIKTPENTTSLRSTAVTLQICP
ncbi:hypothetical protein lerEdw1_011419 [Lerista edwardsae]|nr:hypothetical protein lerEdw1_011419 [Lerista edwardsae]